jgi:hypothetical protein
MRFRAHRTQLPGVAPSLQPPWQSRLVGPYWLFRRTGGAAEAERVGRSGSRRHGLLGFAGWIRLLISHIVTGGQIKKLGVRLTGIHLCDRECLLPEDWAGNGGQ